MGIESLEVARQSASAGGIMGAVEHDFRTLGYPLQPPGPLDPGDAALRFRPFAIPTCANATAAVAAFLHLMLARQRTRNTQLLRSPEADSGAARIELHVRDGPIVHRQQRRADLQGAAANHAIGLGALPREDRGHARLQNAGLLTRDRFEAGAQERFVIEIDRRDDESRGVITLVASSRPPSPTSSTSVSTRSLGEDQKAMAVTVSK